MSDRFNILLKNTFTAPYYDPSITVGIKVEYSKRAKIWGDTYNLHIYFLWFCVVIAWEKDIPLRI